METVTFRRRWYWRSYDDPSRLALQLAGYRFCRGEVADRNRGTGSCGTSSTSYHTCHPDFPDSGADSCKPLWMRGDLILCNPIFHTHNLSSPHLFSNGCRGRRQQYDVGYKVEMCCSDAFKVSFVLLLYNLFCLLSYVYFYSFEVTGLVNRFCAWICLSCYIKGWKFIINLNS